VAKRSMKSLETEVVLQRPDLDRILDASAIVLCSTEL